MKFTFDFSKETGPIRPMHAVGQPPRRGIEGTYMHYLTDAHIPFSRLHDVGGDYGGNMFVDIPNIFRDFSANEYDPASYDFTFTDLLIKQLIEAECEPIYRLGVTIENYNFMKAYRIFPPSDFAKWARVCEYIIKHYNEGWANGFHYGIKYWEIWNEPDNARELNLNMMWQGTMQEYFELYETTAKHLKKRFGDSIKVGGFASCGFYGAVRENPSDRELYFVEFFEKFLDHVVETNSPIDFFSWHSYASVDATMKMADFVDAELTKRGLGDLETQCNEWNNASQLKFRGTSFASAEAAAMMIGMHDKKTDMMCYYDARLGQSMYGGLFDPMHHVPLCAYYSFKAFGELYALGNRVEAVSDKSGVWTLAAADGEKHAILISNTVGEEVVKTGIPGMKVTLVDSEHLFTATDLDSAEFTLRHDQVALLTNY